MMATISIALDQKVKWLENLQWSSGYDLCTFISLVKSILPLRNSSILRGGSWMNEPLLCRSASRLTWKADKSSKLIGCRVAYAIDVQE